MAALALFVAGRAYRARLGARPASELQDRVALGRRWLERNRPELALTVLNPVDERAEGAGEALAVVGWALVSLDRLNDAERAFNRALELDPNQPEVAKVLAAIELQAGNATRGLELLQAAARLNEHDFRPWYAMGKVYHDLGELQKSADSFAEALKREPKDAESRRERIAALLELEQPELAAPLLAEALRAEPNDARILGLAATQARQLGKADRALELANQALARDPDDRNALLVRSRAEVAAGDNKAALRDLERAIAADPNDLAVLQLLAQVESRLGLNKRAARTAERGRRARESKVLIDRLTKEVAAHPRDPKLRLQLGRAAEEAGLTRLAQQSFEAARDLDPGSQPARNGPNSMRPSHAGAATSSAGSLPGSDRVPRPPHGSRGH